MTKENNPNWPSKKDGKKSGGGRDNNPSKPKESKGDKNGKRN